MVFQFKPVKTITIQFPQDKSISLANYIIDNQLILDSSEAFLLLFISMFISCYPKQYSQHAEIFVPIQIEIYSKCFPWTFAVLLVDKYSSTLSRQVLFKKGNWASFTSCCVYIAGRKSRDILDSPLFLVFVDHLQIRCIPNHCHLFQHSFVIFFVFSKTKILRN